MFYLPLQSSSAVALHGMVAISSHHLLISSVSSQQKNSLVMSSFVYYRTPSIHDRLTVNTSRAQPRHRFLYRHCLIQMSNVAASFPYEETGGMLITKSGPDSRAQLRIDQYYISAQAPARFSSNVWPILYCVYLHTIKIWRL